jgi:hypothetical protein
VSWQSNPSGGAAAKRPPSTADLVDLTLSDDEADPVAATKAGKLEMLAKHLKRALGSADEHMIDTLIETLRLGLPESAIRRRSQLIDSCNRRYREAGRRLRTPKSGDVIISEIRGPRDALVLEVMAWCLKHAKYKCGYFIVSAAAANRLTAAQRALLQPHPDGSGHFLLPCSTYQTLGYYHRTAGAGGGLLEDHVIIADEHALNDGEGEKEKNGYERPGRQAERESEAIFADFCAGDFTPLKLTMGHRHRDSMQKLVKGGAGGGQGARDVTAGVDAFLLEESPGHRLPPLRQLGMQFIVRSRDGGRQRGDVQLITVRPLHACNETGRFNEEAILRCRACNLVAAKVLSITVPGWGGTVDLLGLPPNLRDSLIDIHPVTGELVSYASARHARAGREHASLFMT